MENKKGFVKIIEAATMILIITGLLLVYLNNAQETSEDITQDIYESQQSILRNIQSNDSMRSEILSAELDSEFDISGIYENRLINFFCKSKICSLNSNCEVGDEIEKDIYTQETIVSSDLGNYSPRKLKIFCWEN